MPSAQKSRPKMSTAPKATPTPIPAFAAVPRVDDLRSLTGCADIEGICETADDVRLGEVVEVDDVDVDNAVDEE